MHHKIVNDMVQHSTIIENICSACWQHMFEDILRWETMIDRGGKQILGNFENDDVGWKGRNGWRNDWWILFVVMETPFQKFRGLKKVVNDSLKTCIYQGSIYIFRMKYSVKLDSNINQLFGGRGSFSLYIFQLVKNHKL